MVEGGELDGNKEDSKSRILKSLTELYQEGLQSYQSGDYQRAASLFEKIIATDPNSAAVHFSLARCYLKLVKGSSEEDYRLSKQYADLYKRSLELNKSYGGLENNHITEAYFALGVYHQMLKDFSHSIEYLELCLDHDPTRIETLIYLSTSYHFQGNDLASFDNALKAFQLNSSDESVLNQLLSAAEWVGIVRATGLSDEERANLFHELETEQDAFFLKDDKFYEDSLAAYQGTALRKMSIALAEKRKRTRKAAIESICHKRNLEGYIAAIVFQEGERKIRTMGQTNNGDYAFIKDQAGEVYGIWFRSPQLAQKRENLIMICVKHSLSIDIFTTIVLGDYRVLPNTFDRAGGYFVMLGSRLAPGETVPSLETFVWRKGEENPVSQDISLLDPEGNYLRFSCPTCRLPVRVERSKIDPIIGISVGCSNCKNISHVPGAFKTGPLPPNINITGGVIIPIKEFNEWYFHHPVVKSLMDTKQTELLYEYGIYGYCGKCFYQYQKTILSLLPVYQRIEPKQIQIIFMAKSTESAKDLNSLLSGKCPSCGHEKIIGIITDIPNYVREAIKALKTTDSPN